MTHASSPVGRRERNKQEKLDRIIAAAGELFAQRGVDEVTTQQIAEKADIGTGTLFLYAKTKGELLLLVQNAAYAEALDRGLEDSAGEPDVAAAVLKLIIPIVRCNRAHVGNGRTYLREMLFGDPGEPYHRHALEIVARTEDALAGILRRDDRVPEARALVTARIISAVMFVSMAASVNADARLETIVDEIEGQILLVLTSSE